VVGKGGEATKGASGKGGLGFEPFLFGPLNIPSDFEFRSSTPGVWCEEAQNPKSEGNSKHEEERLKTRVGWPTP
jgi:hypothetical protein